VKRIKTYDQYNEGIKSSLVKLSLLGSLLLNPDPIKAQEYNRKAKDSIEYFSKMKQTKDVELNAILDEIKQNLKSTDASKYQELYSKLIGHIESKYDYKVEEKDMEELSVLSIDSLKNMSIYQIMGWIGSLCLAGCGIPQAWVSYKDKHSDGISWAFLLLWAFGEIFAIAYVFDKLDVPLIVNYGVNLLIVGIMLYYKINPKRNTSAVSEAKHLDVDARILARQKKEDDRAEKRELKKKLKT